MALLRRALGETLRAERLRQQRTLREVSTAARVSLGYLSEVERGQKEASSELLAAICDALTVEQSNVLRRASDALAAAETPAAAGRPSMPPTASVAVRRTPVPAASGAAGTAGGELLPLPAPNGRVPTTAAA